MKQLELADKLGVTDKSVSKWERGLCLPDVSLYKNLCDILDITLNDFFAGEKIKDEEFKEKAEDNLLIALENSSFTLKDKIKFYKKKWIKEHIFTIILSTIIWLVICILLKLQNVDGTLLGGVSGILTVLFYIVINDRMMIYVENNAYKKIEK